MILSFFSSRGWESWDIASRPLIPERMPVLVDDDLLLEDGPGAPRPSVAVNQWLRELPSNSRELHQAGEETAGQQVTGSPEQSSARADASPVTWDDPDASPSAA
jgi:hypothetical protein